MFRHAYKLILLASAYLASAVILFFPLPPSTGTLNSYDGSIHTVLFLILGLITFLSYPKHIMRGAWGLLVYACYSEIIQFFIPTRSVDLRDIFHDVLGILIALAIVQWVANKKRAH